MICWYCHWGWPKPVAEIFQTAVTRLGGDDTPLTGGQSGIVWGNENFDWAEKCLERFNEQEEGYTAEELAVGRWSLEELAKLPLEVRCVRPEEYDGDDPHLFPPPVGVEMVKII